MWDEWVRGLGLGFTNPLRTGEVWGVYLCLCCGGVGGVGRRWGGCLGRGSGRVWVVLEGDGVGVLVQRLGGCGGVMFVSMNFWVEMAGLSICVLCSTDTCASYVHPVFNHVAHYRYLIPNMYLSVADITKPVLLMCCCRTWISLDIVCFYEEQCQPSNGEIGSTQLAERTARSL